MSIPRQAGGFSLYSNLVKPVDKMLVKIFSTATLIVLAWMSVQMLQTKQSLNMAQVNVQKALAEMRAELYEASASATKQNESMGVDLVERMDQLSAEQLELKESANKVDPSVVEAKDKTIASLQETAELQNALATVLKADLAAFDKKGTQAAELLKSTKEIIWKTSGKWSKSKDALRELMAPIDILASKWNSGDYSGDTKPIQKVLISALEIQSEP